MIKALLIIFSFFLLSFRFPSPVLAQTIPWTADCKDITNPDIATLQGFECIFKNLLSIIIPLAGLAAFITLLFGGFQYITSAGDPKQLQKATGTITGAIIGIVVILAVWFIFRLLNAFTGLNLLQFQLPV
ncbi:MAG: pilin [Patescibacteria group bacterium]|nr:pilin [Patescibacteria group bacterium]